MESISAIEAERKIKASGLKFVTVQEILKLFQISSANTAHKMLQRWEKYKILTRCSQGIYFLSDANIDDFEIANHLVSPSYISLETALNYYGILSQFPYVITSVTTKKNKAAKHNSKDFEYAHLSPGLFWGYEKQGEALMAVPEKAIVDQLYLTSKGLRSVHVDEWDLSKIKKDKLKNFTQRVHFAPFIKLLAELHLI